jgi:hypothetical protein
MLQTVSEERSFFFLDGSDLVGDRDDAAGHTVTGGGEERILG